MKLIPVIDLMGGHAVWAHGGRRDRYRPLATRLCPDGDPVGLATRCCAEYGVDTVYLADLDAIAARGDNRHLVRAIAAALPRLTLWVDAGIGDAGTLRRFIRRWPARPVIGSETLRDTTALRTDEAQRAVLSLDFRAGCMLGPADLPACLPDWPRDLILMALERVGSGHGPQLRALARFRRDAPGHRLYSAGGVRDVRDLRRLRRAGAAGALVASALHQGRISAADLSS